MNKICSIDGSSKLDDEFFSKYKFKLSDCYNKNYLNANGQVKCADGGCLVSDEDGFVGPNEFFK
jgi:hypothetical protein